MFKEAIFIKSGQRYYHLTLNKEKQIIFFPRWTWTNLQESFPMITLFTDESYILLGLAYDYNWYDPAMQGRSTFKRIFDWYLIKPDIAQNQCMPRDKYIFRRWFFADWLRVFKCISLRTTPSYEAVYGKVMRPDTFLGCNISLPVSVQYLA